MVRTITLTELEENLNFYEKKYLSKNGAHKLLFHCMRQGKGYNQICNALALDTSVGKRPIKGLLKSFGYTSEAIDDIFVNYERIKYFDLLLMGECKNRIEYYKKVHNYILDNDYEYLTNLLLAPEVITSKYISEAKTRLIKFYSKEYMNAPLRKSVEELNMEFDYQTKYWFQQAKLRYGTVGKQKTGFLDKTTAEQEHVIFKLE